MAFRKPALFKNSIHSIITLDSPLNDTERGFFRVTRCGVPFEDKEDVLALEPLPGAIILECKPHPDPDTEQSWADLTGCDPAVTNKITDADATGSIIVTSKVNFVHVNSTGIGDLLPGYWREDNPPCRARNVSDDPFDVANAFMGFAHTCMLSSPEELRAVRRAVRTDLYDDSQAALGPLPGRKWITPPDLSTNNTDGWVRGSAQNTQTTGDFASLFKVGGSILKVLYTGSTGANGQLRVDGVNQGAMPDQDGCVKYGFGHDGFVDLAPLPPDRRPRLCQWSIGVPNGAHTVEVTSDIDCGQVCPEFYFDAVEALPPVGLRVVAQPPVNVLVTDPDGRRVGFDESTETGVNEIPGATYSGPGAWPQVI
jgi:hypothetical protein